MRAQEQCLRKVTAEDETIISQWLRDPEDCKMAIGHHPFVREDFVQWLAAEDQLLWILEDHNGPVGYGEVWVDYEAHDVELAHIIVNPDHRGRGLGKMLTARLYEKAAQFGFPRVYMRVYPGNTTAIACYRSAHFTPLEELLPGMSPEWIWLHRAV